LKKRAKRSPSIGVALSGGGVRGLSHLGILQVLEEAEVPIDFLAGTSMGGLVAGLYAAGVPLGKLIAVSERTGISDFAARDQQWRGLFGHQKMERFLVDVLGRADVTFEDLNIPITVVATDIETGEAVFLREGPLIPALMATSAYPILFSPVYHQGRWLVDGGVVNNFPVDVVRHMGADRVLGVTVPAYIEIPLENRRHDRTLSPRGLRFFNNLTRDWKLPFLIAEASVGISIRKISEENLSRYPPDVLLEVCLPNVGVMTSDDNAAIVAAGRRVALEHQDELIALRDEPLPPRFQRWLASWQARFGLAWADLQDPKRGF
jgi:NTE family protein